MDFKDNMINNDGQMLKKKEQQDILMQTAKKANEEVQAENKEIGEFHHEVLGNEQIKQQNINTIRKMEKMSKDEKKSFTKVMTRIADSSGQLQKDRRISGLKKSQREEIAKGMEANDQKKKKELKKAQMDRSNNEKLLYASYLEAEDIMVSKKERADVTGYERRTRAAKNVQKVKVSKEKMEQDLDNLIHNMRMDALLEKKYEPDPRFQDIRKVSIHFSHLLKERDKELGIFVADRKKYAEQYPALAGLLEIAKGWKSNFEKLVLHVKNITQNFGIAYEVKRSELRAMVMAKKQLEEDYELQPSAYTLKLLQELDLRIINKRIDVEATYEKIKHPSTNEEMINQLNALDEICRKLAEKANLIEEKRRSLEGLQGEALKEQQEKVKAEELIIEQEAKDLIADFKY